MQPANPQKHHCSRAASRVALPECRFQCKIRFVSRILTPSTVGQNRKVQVKLPIISLTIPRFFDK
jgi:hypothetical protein